jgi:hypothetical protein
MTAERNAYSARYQTKTTQSTSDTQSTFSPKFFHNKTEGFITRWDDSKVSTEQIGWQGHDLWLRLGYVSISWPSLSTAKRLYRSMTGPTAITWIVGRISILKLDQN